MAAMDVQTYCYRVDAADKLVWVNSWWLAFAQENGAENLTEEAVLGRSLWDYIQGETIRRLFVELHGQIRSTGKTVVLPFRCDSPLLQRHMRMTISNEEDGFLDYECVVIRLVPQPRLNLLDAQHPRDDSVLTMCSCCKRALLEPSGWLDINDICVRLGLFEQERVPQLRNGVCPQCSDVIRNAPDNGNAA